MQFSKEHQPKNRGTRKGVPNKNPSLKLIKAAQPEIIQVVIDKALGGDLTACNILLKRVMPELKSTACGAEMELLQAKLALAERVNSKNAESDSMFSELDELLN